jgi:hypothetical protein
MLWYSSVTEEYQDGKNSRCEFFGLVPFLQLAIKVSPKHKYISATNNNSRDQ